MPEVGWPKFDLAWDSAIAAVAAPAVVGVAVALVGGARGIVRLAGR
jgi:hypothetical protein